MKRVLAVVLMLLMLAGMTVPAFAEPGSFLRSPSKNPTPEIIEFEPIGGEECEAELIITSYANRHTLSDFLRKLIEKAASDIIATDDLTTLNNDLRDAADAEKADYKDLAVSNLFDMHVVGCDGQCGHTGFRVVLRTADVKNFIGLLHMGQDEEWELISGAHLVDDGENVEFIVKKMSPFAIVVDTDPGQPPQTGDSSMLNVYAVVMAASALGAAGIFVFMRKRKI